MVVKEEVYVLKTKAFHKIIVEFVFPSERIDAFSIYGNLLIRLLTKKTKNYPTEEAFSNALIEHFVMSFTLTKSNCGENWFYTYHMEIADNKILKEKDFSYQKTIDFLLDAIYNPYALEDSFHEEEVEIARKRLSTYIESGQKNILSYSSMRLEEIIDDCGYFNDSIYQHQDDIKRVSSQDLYSYYKEAIGSKRPFVFIAGNVEDSFVKLLKESFPKSLVAPSFIPYQVKPFLVRNDVKIVEEKASYNQSIVKFVYKVLDYQKEDEVFMSVLSFLLSSQSSNVLKEYLRTKEGLIYTASTDYHIYHGFFMISAQIYRDTYEKTKETIYEIIKHLQDVTFIKERLENVKERKRINLERQKDSFSSIFEDFKLASFGILNTLQEEYEVLKDITAEEFVKFIKRLKLDTIYYLEGSKDE